MKYVLVSIALGLFWAGTQYYKGEITDPRALIGPIIVFGLFGLAMWGIKAAVTYLRQRQGGVK